MGGTGFDAVVVGSGPNGLAAAVTLAAAGIRVLVLEGAKSPGGGCRTEELTLPGFHHDACSAVHPLALASPFFRNFGLGERGVRLLQPEVAFAHPLDNGEAALVFRSVEATAAALGADGNSYRALLGPIARRAAAVADWVLSDERRPPRDPLALSAYAVHGLRSATSVARRFRTPQARGLWAGVAAHSMMPLTRPPTAGVATLLTALAHRVGWPLVEGGSSRITEAMVAALTAGGGQVETGSWVRSLADLPSARAVLLDVSPQALVQLAGHALPDRYRRALERFHYGAGVCKVDFALSGPVPWTNPGCRRAGTVHLGGTLEEVASSEDQVARGRHPERPYVLTVQPGVVDPGRAPLDQHTLWSYCHVPNGSKVDMADRIVAQVERFAPGFRELILARTVRTAAQQAEYDPNCVGGDIACGAQTLRQTFFRPTARWSPHRTPLPGVYLCSSATPPGPGVHGQCGALAARAALADVFGVRSRPDVGRLGALVPPAG